MAPAPAGHQHSGYLGSTQFCSGHWSLVREDKAGTHTFPLTHHMRNTPPACIDVLVLTPLQQHAHEDVSRVEPCPYEIIIDHCPLMRRIGKELSGPLVSTLVGLVFANTGVLSGSNAPAVYDTVNKFILPLAIPLLLFSADLRCHAAVMLIEPQGSGSGCTRSAFRNMLASDGTLHWL